MKFRYRLILCSVLFALVISAKQFAPQYAQEVKTFLFGNGDDPVTQACIAFEDAADSGLRGSVYAFCHELYEKR